MNKKIFIIIIIILIIIISIIIGSLIVKYRQNQEINKLSEKTENEINYLNERIISIMNELNNISFETAILKKTNETVTKEETSNESTKDSNSSTNNGENKNSDNDNNNNNNSNNNNNGEKVQLKYNLEKSSILLTDLKDIDWEYIKRELENIHTIWPNCIIDLYEQNVNDQEILGFSDLLNIITINIKQEQKEESITNLAVLYSYLPRYLEKILDDNRKINLINTKSSILNTYALIETNEWENMKVQLQNAIESFSNIINNVEEANEYTENRISKTYILLNELNNSINLQDKELYYIKYKNVMEELIKL